MSKVSFSAVELWFLFWREIVEPVEQLCDSHNLCFFEYRIMCFTSFIRIFEDRNLLCFKPQCCKLPYSAQYSKFTSILVKPQDARVLVRAKSYKSQRKNEEPWRLQVITVFRLRCNQCNKKICQVSIQVFVVFALCSLLNC